MGAPNLEVATRLGANQDTSLPFAGSNVPEYIELLDGNGNVMQTLRLIVNQVGTVQAVVDVATGEIVQRLGHDEFGRVLFDSNPGLQPFGFAGGLVDADTGLVRFGARDYEPLTGRWTARDPVRFAGGDNAYTYSGANPVTGRDFSGLAGPSPACYASAIGVAVSCARAATACAACATCPETGLGCAACGACVGFAAGCAAALGTLGGNCRPPDPPPSPAPGPDGGSCQ